jgi:hypothetical protein
MPQWQELETATKRADGTCESCGQPWAPWHLRAPAGNPPIDCMTCGQRIFECQGWNWYPDTGRAEHGACLEKRLTTSARRPASP